MKTMNEVEKRVASLHAGGVIDLHFDLPLGLFLSRPRQNIVGTDFLPEFEAGEISLLGVALYVEDKHLGDKAPQVGRGIDLRQEPH